MLLGFFIVSKKKLSVKLKAFCRKLDEKINPLLRQLILFLI